MKKKVVIVGGGFAGVQIARKLDRNFFEVLLIDKLNHHQFQPLFYQVAASQIEPSSISFPLRYIFRNFKSTQIRMAELQRIIPSKNKIETNVGEFEYDYLIIATGAKTNFFRNETAEKNSFTLKTTYDAISIRNHITSVFEKILTSSDEEKKYLFNLVVVGAGPTGVELAGAFSEIKNNVLQKDYPRIDFSKFSVYLIEGSSNTLNSMSDKSKMNSRSYLNNMGVKIITNTFVKSYDGKEVTLSDGNSILSSTVIWAAGIISSKIDGIPENIWIANNRIRVNRYNQIEGFKNIFALGDIAYMVTPKYPNGHPQVANVAINQAKLLAVNLKNLLLNLPSKEYEYKDLGTMATIGRNKAVVDFPFIKFKGYLAWLIWMFLHLMLILSVKNKLIIFINWAWNYITYDSSLRLILKSDKK